MYRFRDSHWTASGSVRYFSDRCSFPSRLVQRSLHRSNRLNDLFGRALAVLAVYFIFALARRYMSAASVKFPKLRFSVAELDSRFDRVFLSVLLCLRVQQLLYL